MNKVLIRADGSRKSGFGHLSRMAALSAAMERKGCRAVFITWGADDAVRGFLSSRGLAFIETPHAAGEDGARFHLKAMESCGAKLTILDSYQLDDPFRERLKEGGAVVAAVDDIYRHYSRADVVINHNPSADRARYADFSGRVLAGPQFALINQAFADCRPALSPVVLVTLGGTDALAQTDRVLRLLDRVDEDFNILALAGSYSGGEVFSGLKHPLEIAPFTGDMPGLFSRCSAAITGGGITCMELACAGLPFLIVLTDEYQRENAETYARNGVAEYSGALWEKSDEELFASFSHFLSHPQAWGEMARKGRALVDGKGADRVAEELAALIPRV
ncbi:MAG: hypothetical protein HZA04_07595 [Nitrospinae bacterium]|nr:hypothetical protein [Nitrospinota bacterium]